MGIGSVKSEKRFEIHRLKGLVLVDAADDSDKQLGTRESIGKVNNTTRQMKMIQGVREVFEITDLKPKSDVQSDGRKKVKGGEEADRVDDAVQGKLVLIGRYIAGLDWEGSLVGWLEMER